MLYRTYPMKVRPAGGGSSSPTAVGLIVTPARQNEDRDLTFGLRLRTFRIQRTPLQYQLSHSQERRDLQSVAGSDGQDV